MHSNPNLPCPICASKRVHKICDLKGSRTGSNNPLFLCWRCNFYYQRPDYHEDDNTLQGDLRWHIDQAPANLRALKKELELILRYHPKASNLLDIGCGIGTTLHAARDLELQAYGVEPNPYAVKYAKEHFGYDLTQGYFESRMFSEKFDIVILDMVLEHVPEPRILIRDIFKVLNQGGILFLAVPGRRGGFLRILYSIMNQTGHHSLFADNDVHINHFSRKSIESLLHPFQGIILAQPKPGTFIIKHGN